MKITNARIVLLDRVIENGTIEIENERIIGIREGVEKDSDIDAGEKYLAPGIVDLHTHGSGGFDFMDGEESDIHGAAHSLAMFGTTCCLPTTLTSSDEELFAFLDNLKSAQKNRSNNECRMPGAHLEGPYFNMDQKGAQDPRYIIPPKKDHYMKVLEKADGVIKRWSVAPEVDGAMEFIHDVSRMGVVISGGHTKADFDTVGKAVENGMTMLTHYYSAMSSMIKKGSWKILGVTEAGFYFDELIVELISDGCHIPANLLKLIFKLKDRDHIIGISDSMRGAGFESGDSILGPKNNGTPVVIEDGVAKLSDRSCFAGSIATGIRLVKTLATLAEENMVSVFKTVSYNPARIIGMEKEIGSLEEGKYGDFIIFDDEYKLDSVYISGEKVR